MQRNIFRKTAIENLAMPEQLDDAIRVTSPMGWMAIAAVMIVVAFGLLWSVTGVIPTSVAGTAILMRPGGNHAVTTPNSGQLVEFKTKVGDIVQVGQTVAQIRQFGPDYHPYLQYPVVAHCAGRVLEVMVNNGDVVEAGTIVATIEPIQLRLEAVTFMPLALAKKVKPGMSVRLNPSTARQDEFGFLFGTVRSVGEFAATRGGMAHALNNDNLAEALRADGPVVMILIDLNVDPSTPSGYKWSSLTGPPGAIVQGTICSAHVTVQQDRPIRLFIPRLRTLTGL